MADKVVVHVGEVQNLREALGRGVLNWMHAVEADAKADAPVRGGHRSFMSTKRGKAGQVLIGGTLRRSIHSQVWVDGVAIKPSGTDENGNGLPHYPVPFKGVTGIVGTNAHYGLFVELGTVKMAERPFLGPAFDGNMSRRESLIRAGMNYRGKP